MKQVFWYYISSDEQSTLLDMYNNGIKISVTCSLWWEFSPANYVPLLICFWKGKKASKRLGNYPSICIVVVVANEDVWMIDWTKWNFLSSLHDSTIVFGHW